MYIQYTEDAPYSLTIVDATVAPVVEYPILQIEVPAGTDIEGMQVVNGVLTQI